ncbi:ABC transporter permease [Neorhizobium galegae]|uniref:ABC transporter permease n=1 Tax=Neorhizobium galegae TaxID=399 RepID=UPI0006219916|nr:ABC transporter permease [Neorhizobium galegae]CDZ34685.1 Putrescine transport system permease protein PotH [Neorhizobium galegae bv. officinalis]KAA9383585.1 ABC transporter permease [Neorhizobium galegae]KAB1111716.1 ABC transporter permease [Neorhizobium galegae]MCM2500787.1 ABC transporter permease [Neorhizobium galegae]MCQ1769801.1 ABC transporter permease [Neorhizobium galegae]
MGISLSKLTEKTNIWPWLLLAPLGIYMLIFFVVPLAEVAIMSFTEPKVSLANYQKVLTGALYQRVFLNTFVTAAFVTLCCLLVGYPLAYLMAHSKPRTAMLILLLVTMSFWTSFLVRTYSWMVLLGNNGPLIAFLEMIGFDKPPQLLFTRFSSTLAMVHILAPYMIMNIYTVMKKIDPALIRSAESLGARGWSLFRHVYLPLTAPGIANGSVLVFVICLGFYVTPVLLGSPREQMIAGLIGHQIEEFLAFGLGSAMAMILLVVTLIILTIYHRRFGLDKLWG